MSVSEACLISSHSSEGLRMQAFNQRLQAELNPLVYEIPTPDRNAQRQRLAIRTSGYKQFFLAAPALFGWLLHLPLYFPLQKFVFRKTAHNDHYDSVLAALLLFAYPFYLVLITITIYLITSSLLSFLLLLVLPFTAWALVQIKPQLDK
ncbi:MAG: hypothetical protein EOO00_03895 [Chitinophagaceae bacterium]|nr:MAG: hypothetical protein EOO00_03895 [Chitinophagaceae bacterium]